MDTGRIFAQKSYNGLRSSLFDSLKKSPFVFLCFSLSSPHPFPCSNEICKNRIYAHKRDEIIMAWRVIPGQLSSKCEVSADISVHVCSLRPQTSQPNRFLKDHQAWANPFHCLSSNCFLIFGSRVSLKMPHVAQLLKRNEEEKKIAVKHKLKSVWWQPLPLPLDTTGGHDLTALYSQ